MKNSGYVKFLPMFLLTFLMLPFLAFRFLPTIPIGF